MGAHEKSKPDFISILHDVLLAWLKSVGVVLFASIIFFALFSLLQDSIVSIAPFKHISSQFFVVSLLSLILFIPCLLIQSYSYKELILSGALNSRNSIFLGAISSFIYAVFLTWIVNQGKTTDDGWQFDFTFPMFGMIAGACLGYYVFPKFERRYYPWSVEIIESELDGVLDQQGIFKEEGWKCKKLKISTLVECIFLSFMKAIFWAILCVGIGISLILFLESKGAGEVILTTILLLPVTFGVGVPLGFVIASPCMIASGFLYSWLYKNGYHNKVWWIISSFLLGQIYVLVLYALGNDHFLTGLSKFFYVPVSILTGYFSWKNLVSKLDS